MDNKKFKSSISLTSNGKPSIKRPHRTRAQRYMYLYFILGTAAVLLTALLTASMLEYVFTRLDIIVHIEEGTPWYWIAIFSFTSLIIGLGMAMLLSRVLFKPINTVIDGMSSLAEGEYTTRIDLSKYESMQGLASTFNRLAEELESTEILRSDFVNDFSHELKTPIVSLVGLIGLMKNENLSRDKRHHYLEIMESEANRLKQMTENALYLSKIESQGILTHKTRFNISEQIRSSLLLLEKKWAQKSLSLSVDFDEFYITANEDMLKQVWINIIDNAIKFANPKSELEVAVEATESHITVAVTNEGKAIDDGELELIFNKFYQADKSRSTEGNGIGLSIVRHITELHGGSVSAKSEDGKTTFTVALPIQ